jgi:hypothetical protein
VPLRLEQSDEGLARSGPCFGYAKRMQSTAVAPVSSRERLEHLEHLERALARLTPFGATLAPVRIRAWRGEPLNGFFVRIDASTFALHVGDGHYVWLDLEHDFDGLLPSEAIRQMQPRA